MIDKEYSQDKIFLHLDRLGDFVKGENVAPIVIETNITNRCNANCVWCSEREYRSERGGDQIDTDVMLRAIGDAAALGVRGIVFEGGGEPTVHPDLLKFAQAANTFGIDCGLITNGMRLRDSGVAANPGLFRFIRVSFDAGTPEAYSKCHGVSPRWFNDVLSQISAVIQGRNNTVVGLSFIVTEDNLSTAKTFVEIARHMGVDYVQFKAEIFENSFRIPFQAREIIDGLVGTYSNDKFKVFAVRLDGSPCLDRKDYKFCFAHRFIGAITANGEVQLCCNLKHEHGDSFSFGNLNKQTFKQIWNGPKRKKLIERVESDPKFVQQYCGQCRMDGINRVFNWIRDYGGMRNFI